MFKPMLAGKVIDPELLEYPLLASPKRDGIRCLIINGVATSRNLKPIPNLCVRDVLRGLPSFDGELIVGKDTGKGVLDRTKSGVMTREGAPAFTLWVFDIIMNARLPYNERTKLAKQWAGSAGNCVQYVEHVLIKSAAGLLAYEKNQLKLGFEGVCVRSLDGPYKHGRSTESEGYLLKLTRRLDSEAEVIAAVEKQHNDNELTADALGRAKRTSHKAGKRAAGTLGAFQVKDCYSGVEFSVGAGFTDAQRESYWSIRDELVGGLITYRFKPGGKNKPREPVFVGFRDAADTSL